MALIFCPIFSAGPFFLLSLRIRPSHAIKFINSPEKTEQLLMYSYGVTHIVSVIFRVEVRVQACALYYKTYEYNTEHNLRFKMLS